MTERFRELTARVKGWYAYRAWQRFSTARGNLLAAGIAYYGFFSLFPAAALAAVVFGFVLRGNPQALEAIALSLDSALPGFVKTPDNPDGLIQLAAPEATTLSLTGLVAFATLVLGGLGWVSSLREGIRGVFGVSGPVAPLVLAKARDLGVLVLLGLLVLVSTVLTALVGAAAQWVADLVRLGNASWTVAIAGTGVSLLVDTAIMVVLLRVLSGVPLPWRDIRAGALVGGIGMTTLKLVGAQLVARATANPLFGAVVVAIGLLFWLNLMARIVLIGAAWAANDIDVALATLEAKGDPNAPAAPAGPADTAPAGTAPPGAPPAGTAPPDTGGVDAADPRARALAGIPHVGVIDRRDRDRVSIAAGALVGAGATMLVGSVSRALRALTRR